MIAEELRLLGFSTSLVAYAKRIGTPLSSYEPILENRTLYQIVPDSNRQNTFQIDYQKRYLPLVGGPLCVGGQVGLLFLLSEVALANSRD